MSTTATVYPTASFNWTNPDLANAVGSGAATADTSRTFIPADVSYEIIPTPNLLCTAFTGINSGVGSGDTILGITVEIGCSHTGVGTPSGFIYLARGGALVGASKSLNVATGGTYGGASDLWSGSWTGANLSDLQVVCFARKTTGTGTNTVSVDYVRVTVTYSASTPSAFSFTDITGATQGTAYTSNAVVVAGLGASVSVPVTITGSSAVYAYEKNSSGVFTTAAGTAVNGDSFRVRVLSAASAGAAVSATLTIGGVSDTYSVTTSAADTTPTAFGWTSQSGVALSTTIYSSGSVVVAGINAPAAISVSGASGKYSKNGSAYTAASGTVVAGDVIAVSGLSSNAYSTGQTVTVTIGGVSGTFVITTRAADTTPNAFSFTDVSGASTGIVTPSPSNPITIGGIEAAASLTFSASGNGSAHQYQKNGGAWTNIGSTTINNGDTLSVRMTSPGSPNQTGNLTVTIGGVSDTFNVSTGSDTVPAQFTFVDVTSLPGLLNVSNTQTITSITVSVPADCVGGEFQINSTGSWLTTGNVVATDTVRVRAYASLIPGVIVNVVLSIGGVSDTFSITTRNTPNSTDF